MKYVFTGPVYRHLSKDSYADQFANGESIRVSTFAACREYEDLEQGDPGEGHLFYLNTHITDEHPRFHEVAAQLGMDLGGAQGVTLSNNFKQTVVPDVYVICFSMEVFGPELKQKFGSHAVKVRNIVDFMWPLLDAMNKVVPVQAWAFGPVTYKDRLYRDLDEAPGHICFVKPPVPFSPQREFRLLISCPPGHVYKTFNVTVPLPKGLCVRVT